MNDDDDDDDDDDDELVWFVIKVDHRTEPIFMELTELLRIAFNQTTMKTTAFQQSVTCGQEGGQTVKGRHNIADTCGKYDHPSAAT